MNIYYIIISAYYIVLYDLSINNKVFSIHIEYFFKTTIKLLVQVTKLIFFTILKALPSMSQTICLKKASHISQEKYYQVYYQH